MSRIATDWAWSQVIKPATHKLILLSMADRADEHHCCYPSIARLEKDTGLDRKTIQKGVAAMIESGLLTDTGKRAGATNQVRVLRLNIDENAPKNQANHKVANKPKNRNVPNIGNNPKNGNVTENGNNPKNGMGNDPNFGMGNDPKNGIQNQSLNHPMNHIPPSGDSAPARDPAPPPKPKRQSKADEFVAFVTARGVSEATARDWWQYRAGKPMTESAWQRHCTQAEAAGISVQEAAAFAAGKEWRAFYAEGYQREQVDLALAHGQPPQSGRTFDQTGREVSPGAGVPMTGGFGGQPQRTSKVAMGIAVLEEMKEKIRRGEI